MNVQCHATEHNFYVAHKETFFFDGRSCEPMVVLYCFCTKCGEPWKSSFNDEGYEAKMKNRTK